MFGRRKIQLKSDAELAAMSRAGVVTSLALDAAVAAADPARALAAHLPEPPRGRTVVIGAGKGAGRKGKPPGRR